MFEEMDKEKKESLAMVGSVLAGDSIGIVAHDLLIALDAKYPAMKFKPSLIGDLAALILGVWGGLTLDFPLNVLVASTGGYISTDLWRYAMELFPKEPQVRVATVAVTPIPPKRVAYVSQNSVVVKPTPMGNQGKYIVMA